MDRPGAPSACSETRSIEARQWNAGASQRSEEANASSRPRIGKSLRAVR